MIQKVISAQPYEAQKCNKMQAIIIRFCPFAVDKKTTRRSNAKIAVPHRIPSVSGKRQLGALLYKLGLKHSCTRK
jgi:hypothetical protein